MGTRSRSSTAPIAVGMVVQRYPPAVGGVEHHVQMLAEGLSAHGLRTEVITTEVRGHRPANDPNSSVRVHRFLAMARGDLYFFAPGLMWWLLRNAHRFHVIHAHSYHSLVALQAALATRVSGVPLVLTLHYHGSGHSRFRNVLHGFYRRTGRWLVAQAQMVVCVSEAERRLVLQDFGANTPTVVIPNGVVKEMVIARRRPARRRDVLLLTVGRLERYKGVDRLVRMLSHLPVEYSLVVIGDGPDREKLQRLVARLDLIHRVRFLGRVSQQVLLHSYSTADLFVSVSSKEAFGMAALEAGATGLPLVLTAIPAHKEIAAFLPAAATVFVPLHADSEELASAVQRSRAAAYDPDPTDVTVPTWSAAVDQVIDCYCRVVTHHSRQNADNDKGEAHQFRQEAFKPYDR